MPWGAVYAASIVAAMHGPARDGVARSAGEVTWQWGISRMSWLAMVRSKTVTTIGTWGLMWAMARA
ncbi:hypothetical protein ACLBYD_19735 [Rhodococcus sp. C26F]